MTAVDFYWKLLVSAYIKNQFCPMGLKAGQSNDIMKIRFFILIFKENTMSAPKDFFFLSLQYHKWTLVELANDILKWQL